MALVPNALALPAKAPAPVSRNLFLEAQDLLQEPILAGRTELWLERLRREPPPEPSSGQASRPQTAAQRPTSAVRKVTPACLPPLSQPLMKRADRSSSLGVEMGREQRQQPAGGKAA
eukprot:757458-Hanusia_phi.AAC.13